METLSLFPSTSNVTPTVIPVQDIIKMASATPKRHNKTQSTFVSIIYNFLIGFQRGGYPLGGGSICLFPLLPTP